MSDVILDQLELSGFTITRDYNNLPLGSDYVLYIKNPNPTFGNDKRVSIINTVKKIDNLEPAPIPSNSQHVVVEEDERLINCCLKSATYLPIPSTLAININPELAGGDFREAEGEETVIFPAGLNLGKQTYHFGFVPDNTTLQYQTWYIVIDKNEVNLNRIKLTDTILSYVDPYTNLLIKVTGQQLKDIDLSGRDYIYYPVMSRNTPGTYDYTFNIDSDGTRSLYSSSTYTYKVVITRSMEPYFEPITFSNRMVERVAVTETIGYVKDGYKYFQVALDVVDEGYLAILSTDSVNAISITIADGTTNVISTIWENHTPEISNFSTDSAQFKKDNAYIVRPGRFIAQVKAPLGTTERILIVSQPYKKPELNGIFYRDNGKFISNGIKSLIVPSLEANGSISVTYKTGMIMRQSVKLGLNQMIAFKNLPNARLILSNAPDMSKLYISKGYSGITAGEFYTKGNKFLSINTQTRSYIYSTDGLSAATASISKDFTDLEIVLQRIETGFRIYVYTTRVQGYNNLPIPYLVSTEDILTPFNTTEDIYVFYTAVSQLSDADITEVYSNDSELGYIGAATSDINFTVVTDYLIDGMRMKKL